MVTGVILARVLGPSDRGELAAVILWPSFLAIVGSLGLPEALTYHTARVTMPAGVVIATGLVLAVAQSSLMVAVGAIIVRVLLVQQSAEMASAAYLALLLIPLNLVTLAFAYILNGLQRFASFQTCRLIVSVSMVGGLAGLALLNSLTVRSAVVVYLMANLATAVAAWLLLRHRSQFELRLSSAMMKHLLRYGIQSHLGVVSSTLNERLDQLIISLALAPARLGIYVVAVTLAAPANIIGNSVAVVALPYIAHLGDETQRAVAARRLVSLTLVFSALSAVPLILLAPSLVQFFFGSAYAEAGNVARIVMVGTVVFSTGRALSAILKAIGHPLDVGMAELAALGLTVVGLATLLPLFDITGAAIASLIAYAASTAWMARRASLVMKVPATQLLLPGRQDLVAALALGSRLRDWWSGEKYRT